MSGLGLRTFIEGNPSGPTVVFVHGWPDDHTMWDNQVAHLKDRYRCVTTDLPGFSGDDSQASKWGYSMEDVVKRLEKTIEALGNGEPVILVAHDWGCTYAFILEKKRPDLVRKMVALDVGGAIDFWPSLGLLAIVCYQVFLVAAFLLGGPVGDWMARFFARLVKAPSASRVARASVCYPYFHFWNSKLFGQRDFLADTMPKCPILFLYGALGIKKIMKFHADWWVEDVKKKEGSKVAAMAGAGHWVMKDQAEDVNRQLESFFAE